MVRNLNWILSFKFLLTLVGALSGLSIYSQEWKLISSQSVESPVRIVSKDRFNNILINDHRGNIHKFDSLAHPLTRYASPEYGLLTSLQAWSSLRVFLFYVDTQRYTFLDRFLSPNEFSEFPSDLISLVSLAAPSSDNQIWLLDQRLLSLMKFDANFSSITLSQSLSQLSDTLDLNPYQLMEYQNRVYLGDEILGILVFDNMANYIHTIDKKGIDQFHFQDQNIYYLNNNQLHIRGLYQDWHQVVDLPENNSGYQHALPLNDNMLLVAGNRLELFRYKPR